MLTPVNAGEIRLSLESDDTTGTGALMEMIYQCDNEATKIHTAVALIESGENRKNAAEAEAALAIMHTELERIRLVGRELCGANQEILSTAAYQIYDEMIVTIKEPEYVKMYPAETDKKEGGSVVTGYMAFLAGFTIAGIIAAFMVIVIRKALTESHENK
jgi:hypothetical protein